MLSVSAEQVSCIYFFFHIIKALVIAVCNDGVAHFLELSQIVDHHRAKEGITVFQRRLINHNRCALGLDALHDTLNGALAEVIGIRLHGQTVNTDGHRLFLLRIVLVILVITVVVGQF